MPVATTTILDVAARAGVSVATVSRALRGLPNVAPSTRARVIEAAETLNYVVNPQASRLAAGRTRTAAIVVPMFSQWYFTQVVTGAEAVLAAAGYDALLYSLGGLVGRQRFLDTLPFRKRVDVVIVIDVPLGEDEQHLLASAGVPVVMVGASSELFSTVRIDNADAAAAGTRHLIELGHERIGLIADYLDEPLHFPAPLERRLGYQRALEEHGLHAPPSLDVCGGFSLQGGAEAMAQLLDADGPPTAVFAQSDEMAIGALKTLRDAGLRVPGDVSLIGFDGHDMAEFIGLTTVSQPVMALGETAAQLFLQASPNDTSPAVEQVVLPTELVVRHTTAPPRATNARGP